MRSGEKRNPLMGLKMFPPLQELCDGLRLHKSHPNRNLHLDDYLSLMLLAFFNPAITGLRQLVELPEYPVVNRNLGLTHTSLGSFSEASAVFDPEPLRHIFLELSKEACAADGPARPAGLPEEIRVLVADGSIWKLLPRMVPELYRGAASRARKAEFKAHLVFNVFDQVPTDCIVTDGDVDERHVLPLQLESGAMYVLDRGYHSYPVYQQILQAENSLVARLRCDSKYEVLDNLPLPQEAQTAGVTLDQRVRLLSYNEPFERPLRIVRARVVCPESKNLDPKHKRGKHAAVRGETSYELILLTDRFDMAAEEVLTIYKQRWQIELFFRWFKCVLKCRHLFSETANGFALQMYSALITSLLVVIYTRRKPNKMLLWTLQLYFQGIASRAQVEAKVKKCKLPVN